MTEHRLRFDFTARYFKSSEITTTTKQVWYVLHGYGQLAKYFARKFDSLAAENICVIAPEGLSHFYLEDLQARMQSGNNRVGATWMTRENREMDIENYIAMLDIIHQKETAHLEIPVTLLGFSQGAATITRWVLRGNVRFDQLILWAGIFPPDMNFEAGKRIFLNKKIKAVFGTQDPFVTPERLVEMKALSDKLGIQPEIIRFTGTHDLDESTLRQLI